MFDSAEEHNKALSSYCDYLNNKLETIAVVIEDLVMDSGVDK